MGRIWSIQYISPLSHQNNHIPTCISNVYTCSVQVELFLYLVHSRHGKAKSECSHQMGLDHDSKFILYRHFCCILFPSGEDVAFYFGWMNFYATYIIIPALVGVAMYMFRPGNVTVDTDPYLPFFSVFMAIWAVLFVVVSVNVFLGLMTTWAGRYNTTIIDTTDTDTSSCSIDTWFLAIHVM